MLGYYHMPEATKEAIDGDGWLHTGDLGKLDARGYLTYTGRKKELIIRGGENIAPGEIENILCEDPRVDVVKVIGVPDRHYTEEVCACVVKREDMTEDEVRELVRCRAAAFKIPRYVLFMDSFPLLPNGKIDRKTLQKTAIERLLIH